MGYDHSECASLFGFCECDDCRAARDEHSRHEGDHGNALPLQNLDDWHLWVIRSWRHSVMQPHRAEMAEMGFTVGPIEVSDGFTGVPAGWYTFTARIPKKILTCEQFSELCAWDRMYGEPLTKGRCSI